MFNPPIRGQTFITYVKLKSRSDPNVFQLDPTLAAGDVKIEKDGVLIGNLATLPTVTPAGGTSVKVTLSATEMDADNIVVTFLDAAGSQWCDAALVIQPTGLITSGTVNDSSPSTTDFDTTLTGFGNDFFNNAFVVFTDGALKGQSRKIGDYVSSTGNISVAALTAAPANGDPFIILGRSE